MTLPASVDLAASERLAESMLAALAPGAVVTIDAEAARRVTTPAVQALISAAKLARQRGAALRLSGPSPALEDAFVTLGLSQAYSELIGGPQ